MRISRLILSPFLITTCYLTSPASAAPSNVDFTVAMSEAVNVTGCPANCPRIAVTVDGQTRYATYSAGTGSASLTFSYAPTIGDLDLDGVTLTSPIDLNGGTITDLSGNALTPLTYTVPNTSGIKIDYPSLSMDFTNGANGRYTLNGTAYNDLSSFLTAAGGSFTRASTATYFDSSGTLQTAASGQPRFDHDPVTHVAKGILIEESRTNYLKSSQQIDTSNADWAGSNTTLILSATSSPIQSTFAYAINEDTSNTTHYFRSRVYTLSDTDNTFSTFVKANGRSFVGFITNANGITTNCVFDLSTGTVSSLGSYMSASITPLNNGWWRISATFNPSAGSGLSTWVGLELYDDSNNSVYAGDTTKGIYTTGFQWELGSFATSYIPTTTAAVTRAKDFITIPTGSWYNQSAGAFFNDVSWQTATGINYPMFFRVDDTTDNNRWNNFFKQSTSQVGVDAYNSATGQGSWLFNSSLSGSMKMAASQKLNSSNAAFGGTLQVAKTSWSPPTVTRLYIEGGRAQKWLKTLKYYPLYISDTQLQLLTQ